MGRWWACAWTAVTSGMAARIPRSGCVTTGSVLQHVHLKDCHTQVIRDVRRDDVGIEAALARGVFTELGKGDSGIDAVVTALHDVGYDGWVVVEQDRLLDERVTRQELVASQRRNLEYLHRLGL